MKSIESLQLKKFEIPEWNYLVEESKSVFHLTESESERLYESKTARIIAAIPFAAGCKDAERTAILHLCAYIAELKGFQKFCSHLPSDDESIYKRLDMISHFNGGDKQVIEHGMDMLALIMLKGYKASQKTDAENRTYNPLNSGAWDYEASEKLLEAKIKNHHNAMLDGIFYDPTAGEFRW